MITDSLQREIASYLAASGLSDQQFGRRAINDQNFVRDLRLGREPRSRTVDRVRSYMRDHPAPAKAEQPALGPTP